MLTVIEKVLFLQDVEIFEHVTNEDLSYIAAIAQEVRFNAEKVVYKEGDISDSMYMVLEGKVKIHIGDSLVMIEDLKDVFGAWSLFDDEVRLVSATTYEDCLLLQIYKEDMLELLADHVGITEGILKAMAKRLHSVARRVGVDPTSS